ncbi:hypothetical protein BO82DRAFT_291516, partial [Aspergillus uvarum CBS 121591]
VLPLYHGPQVTIRIGSGGPTYSLSKDLLCKKSTYFSKMFEGQFKEGKSMSAVLGDDIVSEESFELFIEWLYTGQFKLLQQTRSDQISCLIEVARFADMSDITDLTYAMVMSIKQVLMEDPDWKQSRDSWSASPKSALMLKHVKTEHLKSVDKLPTGNPVRRVLVLASVEPYLIADDFKFLKDIVLCPRFTYDLLVETRRILQEAGIRHKCPLSQDPLAHTKLSPSH